MLTRWGSRWRTLREWSSLEEWMPRLLGLPRPPAQGFRPGLLIVELAGCDRQIWEGALGSGAFPFLNALRERERYDAHDYDPGPGSRAIYEGELFHGRLAGSPGEDESAGEGLLTGGAAWGSMLPGGAAPDEFHPAGAGPEKSAAARWRHRMGTVLDLRRGLPVIYARQTCAGAKPGETSRLARLRRQDRWLRRLYDRARYSRRRDYEMWILLTPENSGPGVALLPGRTRIGRGPGGRLKPRDLYDAARHVLERAPLPFAPAPATSDSLRLVTYNVHRCIGMDGRQSVRRILRVLADLDADFIALQEVSAIGHNQAERLAQELGMQAIFCPTLTGADAYGHGLLSRHPFTIVKVGLLPLTREASWKEPRGVIHVRIRAGNRTLDLVTTHLALGQADRSLQVDTLLGPDWIGALSADEPVALCGDFNFTPGGRNHRLITRRLRDAQLSPGLGAPLKTFSTIYPVARLDHVFLSPHFEVARIHVPRTDLTRVASDHFPLVTDLKLKSL